MSTMSHPRPAFAPRLHKYIGRIILAPIAILWVVLVLQIWLVQLGELLEDVLPYAPPVWEYLGLSLLLLPVLVSIILPIALVGGLLYSWQQLHSRNELTIMLASGASPLQLLRAPLILAGLLCYVQAILLWWGAPLAETQLLKKTADFQQNIPISGLVKAQVFLNPVPGLTLYAHAVQPPLMKGFMMSDTRNSDTITYWFSRQARFVGTGANKQLALYDGSIHREQVSASGERSLSVVSFEQYVHDFRRFQTPQAPPRRKASARYLPELFSPPANDSYAQTQRLQFRAAAHNNLARVLHPLALVMLAGGIMLFGSLDARLWKRRLVLAATASAGWLLVSFSLVSLASNLPYSWWLLYIWPIASIAIISAWMYQQRYKIIRD